MRDAVSSAGDWKFSHDFGTKQKTSDKKRKQFFAGATVRLSTITVRT